MNKDEGNYKLQRIYDQLLIAEDRQPGASRDDVTHLKGVEIFRE